MQSERFTQFCVDLLTLARLWERNFTVTEKKYTFTVLYEQRLVKIYDSTVGRFGDVGSKPLGELQQFQSGATDLQWFLTVQST